MCDMGGCRWCIASECERLVVGGRFIYLNNERYAAYVNKKEGKEDSGFETRNEYKWVSLRFRAVAVCFYGFWSRCMSTAETTHMRNHASGGRWKDFPHRKLQNLK